MRFPGPEQRCDICHHLRVAVAISGLVQLSTDQLEFSSRLELDALYVLGSKECFGGHKLGPPGQGEVAVGAVVDGAELPAGGGQELAQAGRGEDIVV